MDEVTRSWFMRHLPLFTFALLAALAGTSCSTVPVAPAVWHGPESTGKITTPLLEEASGLAPSHLAPGVFWLHNDSGGQPVLYAVGADGRYRGAVRIAGATNIDWEDAASFRLAGQSYLLAADTGDNRAGRTYCVLYIIAEPNPADLNPDRELTAAIAWQIPVSYPGGPRDCECVAVDAQERSVYLISKRTTPPMVYRLPLLPEPGAPPPPAMVMGELDGIPQPSGPIALVDAPWGRARAMPCGFDLAPDHRTAVVLSYGEVYLYHRQPGATWAQAFAGQAQQLPAHGLPQAEAVCFTSDGKAVMVTTEGCPAPLLRYSSGH
jgi:hypothetical protein